jgi:uncharacterized protein YdaU (DUF1376 family)
MTEKKSDTWMPFYVGDYLQATARLTPEQHGAYLLIILDYWTNGPPPNDDAVLAQITRMTPAAWRRAKPALIGYFDIRDGTLIQKRVERERVRAAEIIEKRVKAGKASAAARSKGSERAAHVGTHASTHVEQVRQHTGQQTGRPPQPPSVNTHTSSPTTLRAVDCFNEICAAADWGPTNDSQRQLNLSVVDGWLALGCTLELILASIAQARQRDPSPTRSLKRFDSTIRGKRRDQCGGELPVTKEDVEAITSGVAKRLAVG